MVQSEKFRDVVTNQLLYEYQASDGSGKMLDQSETNSRINRDEGLWFMLLRSMTRNWKGNYENMFFKEPYNLEVVMQRHELQVEAFARKQAIEYKYSTSKAEEAEMNDKKRKGILAILGIGGKSDD